MLSRKELVAAVRVAEEVRQAWESAPDSEVKFDKFEGREWRLLPAALFDAWDRVFAMVKTTDVEERAKSLVLAIDDFHLPVRQYLERVMRDAAAEIRTVPPNGTASMWDTWAKVLKDASQVERRVPAPPRILCAQGMNLRQVAKVWGFRTPSGEPDVAALDKAMADWEGFDIDKWVLPHERTRLVETTKGWDKRCAALKDQLEIDRKEEERKLGRARHVPSIEELCALPNMPINQIARMHRMDPEEVMSYMVEHGLEIPTNDPADRAAMAVERDRRARKKAAETISLEDYDPHDEYGDNIEDRVMACLDDGLEPVMVAKVLSHYRPGKSITVQQISQIRKRWEQGKLAPEKPVIEAEPKEKAKKQPVTSS